MALFVGHLLTLGGVGPTRAGSSPDPEQLSEEGFHHYTAGRFEKAYDAFRRAHDADPAAVFLYNMANCLVGLGRHAEAVDMYERYLSGDADPALRGPVERIAREQERAAQRTKTRLRVESDPLGAQLRVDDEASPRGETPLRTWLTYGVHRLELRRDGHASLVRVASVERGMAPSLRLGLVAASDAGRIAVDGATEGARIEIDDEWVGTAPLHEPVWVAAGTRRVRVVADGVPPVSEELTVTAGTTRRFDAASRVAVVDPPLTEPVIDTGVDVSPPRDDGFRFPWYAWTTLGLTVAGLGTGITFTALTVDKAEEARGESDPDRYDRLVGEVDDYQLYSWIGYGIAGAGAIATTVVLILENTGRDEPAPGPAVSLTPLLRTPGLRLHVRF